MSASVINWQIISLEHDTGLPLLERLPRGVQPTAAGSGCLRSTVPTGEIQGDEERGPAFSAGIGSCGCKGLAGSG
ncbi:helix-turn-helix domain-containing protein [Agrobacterium vitis]|uniref:helix-turn-helix domain-containing protein n=1 Tax=Agrobacterium vitis TaxID=373 RepID=UPI0038F62ECE